MPTAGMSRDAARAKAHGTLQAMSDEEDMAITVATPIDPDVRPLYAERLTRMRPAYAAARARWRQNTW